MEYAAVNDILHFVFGFSVDDNGFRWGKSLARHRVSTDGLYQRDVEYWVYIHHGGKLELVSIFAYLLDDREGAVAFVIKLS
jgi:hypothetical protein